MYLEIHYKWRFIAGNSYQWEIFQTTLLQWEFQDPKTEVRLYHIRPYLGGISPFIALKNRPFTKMLGTSNLGSWVVAIDILLYGIWWGWLRSNHHPDSSTILQYHIIIQIHTRWCPHSYVCWFINHSKYRCNQYHIIIDYWVPTNSEPATPLCDGRDPWRPWRGSMMFTTPSPTPWAPWANAAVSTAGKRSMTRPRRSCTAACGSPMAMRRTGAFFGMPWDVHHLGSSFYMFLWWSQQANYIYFLFIIFTDYLHMWN